VGSFLGADAAMSASGGLLRELESKNKKITADTAPTNSISG